MVSDEGERRRKRILVVEDQLVIAVGIETMLTEMGYEVVGPFARPAPALDALAQEPVDGAVLDANLRGESALPVAEALAARNVPIVIATGYATAGLPALLRRLPRIEKPFTPADLENVLRQAFAGGRSAGGGRRKR
jgi:CheY-like chemotaxis protein